MTQTTLSAEQIAEELSEAQREAILDAGWLHPGGMDPICLAQFVGPWPAGVAQFFTMRHDRLTPLGLEVRAILARKEPTPC